MSIFAATGVVQADDFYTIDTDIDGKISQGEMMEYTKATQNWSTIDEDSDGYLSRDEFSALIGDERLWTQTGWNGGGGPDPAKQNPGETGDLVHEFNALDTDNDGKLSRAEMGMHGGVVEQRMIIDVNQDEYVDSDEFARFEEDENMTNATGWQGKRLKSDLQQ